MGMHGGLGFLVMPPFFFPISLISLGLLAFYSFIHSRLVFLFMQEFLFMNCNFLPFSFLFLLLKGHPASCGEEWIFLSSTLILMKGLLIWW